MAERRQAGQHARLMAVEDVAVCFQQRSGGMILLFRIPPCLQAHHIEGHLHTGPLNSVLSFETNFASTAVVRNSSTWFVQIAS